MYKITDLLYVLFQYCVYSKNKYIDWFVGMVSIVDTWQKSALLLSGEDAHIIAFVKICDSRYFFSIVIILSMIPDNIDLNWPSGFRREDFFFYKIYKQ